MPSSQLDINPERIRAHGKELEQEIAAKIEKARETLSGDGVFNLEGNAFSTTGTMASVLYPPAIQFALENTESYVETVKDYAGGVETTAKNYEQSEEASTVKA